MSVVEGKLVAPSSSKDLSRAVNRRRVEKIVKTGKVSRLISRPSVYAFGPAAFAFILSRSLSRERSFPFSPSLSSPSVARNHVEVSPSTKGVSTERVSSKSRNRKRFPRIFTEFATLVNRRCNNSVRKP